MILHIPKTEKTPEVTLDEIHEVFQVKGDCLPENISNFSLAVIEKLESYLNDFSLKSENISEKKLFKVNFKLGYFNTAAAKFIADVLSLVKTFVQKGSHIKIYWYYSEDDHDMLEAGEDMAKMMDVPVTFVMAVGT